MYQKDYILRMIEMLGEMLRAIFGMINRKQLGEAGKAIDEAYLSILRNDSAFFQQIPAVKLTQTLLEDHNYTNEHLEILAELMFAEGELLSAGNSLTDSIPYYQKSLLLFEFVDEAYRTYSSERLDKIDLIRKKLQKIT